MMTIPERLISAIEEAIPGCKATFLQRDRWRSNSTCSVKVEMGERWVSYDMERKDLDRSRTRSAYVAVFKREFEEATA